jgi:hypothetical protein
VVAAVVLVVLAAVLLYLLVVGAGRVAASGSQLAPPVARGEIGSA